MICREKTAHHIAQTRGPRMDDHPVPKALIDAMDDLDDFKSLLEALYTLQLVYRCANNTAQICLPETGQIAKMPTQFILGGSYLEAGTTDHEHGSLRFTITVVLPFGFDHSSSS